MSSLTTNSASKIEEIKPDGSNLVFSAAYLGRAFVPDHEPFHPLVLECKNRLRSGKPTRKGSLKITQHSVVFVSKQELHGKQEIVLDLMMEIITAVAISSSAFVIICHNLATCCLDGYVFECKGYSPELVYKEIASKSKSTSDQITLITDPHM